MDRNLLATFSDRLRQAIEAAGDDLNQNRLAGLLGITRAGMGNLYHGVSGPSVDVLVGLCRHLNVSADWLLGLSDHPRRRRKGRL